jgi:predicted nucleic acid-binding protein
MIILDTNVISELMREAPNRKVLNWLAGQKPFQLCITTITIAEINRGIVRLSKGKRRTNLENSFSHFVGESFPGRIFSFDQGAADLYGDICKKRETVGLHIDAVDLLIAGIAKSRSASIATRNISDFSSCGVELINPWN